MYESNINIDKHSKKILHKRIDDYIKNRNPKNPYCKALRRKFSLDKFLEVALSRKKSTRYYLNSFFVALEILKKEKKYEKRKDNRTGKLSYEITGKDGSGKMIKCHLREEGKVLYLISCFSLKKARKKKTPHS